MENQTDTITSYLTFAVGEEIFASNVSKILNILEMTKITKVPKSPDYLLGVLNLRGTVLPVIDTRIKFGLSPCVITTNTCILVIDIEFEGDNMQVGAMVDSVQEVLDIMPEQILPPPAIGNSFRSEYITGMYKAAEENFVMLLDLDALFDNTIGLKI